MFHGEKKTAEIAARRIALRLRQEALAREIAHETQATRRRIEATQRRLDAIEARWRHDRD